MCKGIFTSKGKDAGIQETTKLHFSGFLTLKYHSRYFTAVGFFSHMHQIFSDRNSLLYLGVKVMILERTVRLCNSWVVLQQGLVIKR